MRLDGIYTQITEAFKAGNRGRKKESVQDVVSDTDRQIPEDLQDFVNSKMLKAAVEAAVETYGYDLDSISITGDNSRIIVKFRMQAYSVHKYPECCIIIFPARKTVVLKGGVLRGFYRTEFGNDPDYKDSVCLCIDIMKYVELLCGQRIDMK